MCRKIFVGSSITVTINILLLSTFLVLYTNTLSPDILAADSGEFQLVAATLGVAHPPGFPLYTILGYLMTRLPGAVSAATMVSFFSALTSTLTLLVVFQSIRKLTRDTLAAITAVITLGTATTFWAQATTANIRSLTGLFTAVFLYQLIQYLQTQPVQRDKYLAPAAVTLVLGITHHPSLLFIGIIGIVFLLMIDPQLLRQPRRWKRPLLFSILALLPLLYLPLRANSGVPGATATLATWSGFWNHLLARGFSNDFFAFTQPAELWERLKIMGNVMTFQFSPWLLAGMILGGMWLLQNKGKLAFLLIGSFLLHTLITATYRAPQTVEYMIPAYIPAAILLGYGIGRLTSLAPLLLQGWIKGGLGLITAVFVFAAAQQGVHHFRSFDQLQQSTNARDYTQNILDLAPPSAIVLADWHWFTPLRYLQIVEQQRPDLEIHFVAPGEGSYGSTWAARIQTELDSGRSVVATHYDPDAFVNLPFAEPIGEAHLFAQTSQIFLPPQFTPVQHQLAGVGTIVGYQLQTPSVEIGHEAAIHIAWQAASQQPVPLFAHLVGFNGRLVAQDDITITPITTGLMVTRLRLTPRPGALPGDFAIYIGSGDERTQLTTLSVTHMHQPPATQQAVRWEVVDERPFRSLIGYDWDHTLSDQTRLYLHWQTEAGYYSEVYDDDGIAMLQQINVRDRWGRQKSVADRLRPVPDQHYVPLGQGIVWTGGTLEPGKGLEAGTAVTLRPTFMSSQPVERDYAVSVRLIGFLPDEFHWDWWDLNDSIPAMGAIPTLKWIAGSQIYSPHLLDIPLRATSGQTVGATLVLYDTFTNTTLPILDERILTQYAWIPLGTSFVE